MLLYSDYINSNIDRPDGKEENLCPNMIYCYFSTLIQGMLNGEGIGTALDSKSNTKLNNF